MKLQLNPYLSFKDNTREAMQFYQSIFGGKLDLSTFKEFHASFDPSEDDKIMHALLVADSGITFMAADTPNIMEYKPGSNISMSLVGDDADTLKTYFAKLAAGGSEDMPLAQAPWGDTFGMCTDQFGIKWMINITIPKG